MAREAQGTEEALREIMGPPPSTIEVGTVSLVAPDPLVSLGFLVDVALQPSGREVQARLATLGAGALQGFSFPVGIGDEVLVIFPGGDANRGIVLPVGLPSALRLRPTGDLNLSPSLVHPLGLETRILDNALTASLVREGFLTQLAIEVALIKAAFSELQVFAAAMGFPTTATAAAVASLTTFETSLATLYRSTGIKSDGT